MSTVQLAHSKLGASSAERWMNCPGSVALIDRLKELGAPEDDSNPEYRQEGTAAHAFAAECLTSGMDGWEIVGRVDTGTGVVASDEMAKSVQLYLDECRAIIASGVGSTFIETKISSSERPDYFGTVDFAFYRVDDRTLFVRDFKYGQGIAVDPEWNPQLLYYAYGVRKTILRPDRIDVGIVQPRVPFGEPVKKWCLTGDELDRWAEDTLFPAMDEATSSNNVNPGEWCRFCPAKLVCPLLQGMFKGAVEANPRHVEVYEDAALGLEYARISMVKMYIKAVEDTMMRRLMAGQKFEQAKLVEKRADRVWHSNAEAKLLELFGTRAYTEPKLLSPAQVEALSEEAKPLVKQLAFTPKTGYTVAAANDKRPEMRPPQPEEVFRGHTRA